MTKTTRKSATFTRDSLIIAGSVFFAFSCISDVQGGATTPSAPVAETVEAPALDLGHDGTYTGSSFTGKRSLGEFGIELRQDSNGFERGADTMIRITTYSFLAGDAATPRRMRIHQGRSCFSRGDMLAVQELHPVAASEYADGVTSEYLSLGFSLEERVLVHEIHDGERWVESNCTVTQGDKA